jgi:hypothetical protein
MDYPKMRLGHIKSSFCDSIGKNDERYRDGDRGVRPATPLVFRIIRPYNALSQ